MRQRRQKEIDDLVGLHLLFRIDISEEDFIKKSGKVFSVRCVTQNDELMNHFLTSDGQKVTINDSTTTTPISKRRLSDDVEGCDGGSFTQNFTSKLEKTIKVEKPKVFEDRRLRCKLKKISLLFD
ncbi:unnamed protein product [Cuscuta europaea]|uniref:Uncharacterized protein n=1 Tax=Cuscuta europaea TaxID=41803 RepID=A0A9P1EEP7_CUSEU|nr:unnamed protein product [Cuscuta europaea]